MPSQPWRRRTRRHGVPLLPRGRPAPAL